MSQQRAIRAIRGGFHRQDKVDTATSYLEPEGTPEIGQNVKAQINLFVSLRAASDPDEESDWLALTGEVVEVVDSDWVIARTIASTDLHPEDFAGEWLVELQRDKGWDFPWKVTQVLPANPTPAFNRGWAAEGEIGFRIAWLGPDADDVLRQISVSIGGIDAPLGFLPLSLPVIRERKTTIWLAAASDADALETELCVSCSDALIVDVDGPEDEWLEDLPGEAMIIRWDRGIAPDPMTPMQHALKQLLSELRKS